MGVTVGDLDCLQTLNQHGPATASTLARHVESGSVSRMIDRLDAAGFINRVHEFTEAELAVVQRFIDKAGESTTAELTRLRKDKDSA
jgi:DNA-binding MarR family transcriptional regulator